MAEFLACYQYNEYDSLSFRDYQFTVKMGLSAIHFSWNNNILCTKAYQSTQIYLPFPSLNLGQWNVLWDSKLEQSSEVCCRYTADIVHALWYPLIIKVDFVSSPFSTLSAYIVNSSLHLPKCLSMLSGICIVKAMQCPFPTWRFT